jgi:hypothetical protein
VSVSDIERDPNFPPVNSHVVGSCLAKCLNPSTSSRSGVKKSCATRAGRVRNVFRWEAAERLTPPLAGQDLQVVPRLCVVRVDLPHRADRRLRIRTRLDQHLRESRPDGHRPRERLRRGRQVGPCPVELSPLGGRPASRAATSRASTVTFSGFRDGFRTWISIDRPEAGRRRRSRRRRPGWRRARRHSGRDEPDGLAPPERGRGGRPVDRLTRISAAGFTRSSPTADTGGGGTECRGGKHHRGRREGGREGARSRDDRTDAGHSARFDHLDLAGEAGPNTLK